MRTTIRRGATQTTVDMLAGIDALWFALNDEIPDLGKPRGIAALIAQHLSRNGFVIIRDPAP